MKKYNILSNAQYVDCPFDANGNFKQGKSFADLTAWYEYAFTLGLIEPTIFTITATYNASSTMKYVQGATLISKITKITNTSGAIIAEGNSACANFINDNTTSACTLTFHVDSDTYVNLFKEAFKGNTALTQAIFIDWDTATVTATYPHTGMFVEAFSGCSALTDVTLPLYSMEDVAGTDTTDMFSGCTALADIHCYSDYMTTKSWTSSGTDVVVPHEGLTVTIGKKIKKSVVGNIKCLDASSQPVDPTFIPAPIQTKFYSFVGSADLGNFNCAMPYDNGAKSISYIPMYAGSGGSTPNKSFTFSIIVDGTTYPLYQVVSSASGSVVTQNNIVTVNSGSTVDFSMSCPEKPDWEFDSLSHLSSATAIRKADLVGGKSDGSDLTVHSLGSTYPAEFTSAAVAVPANPDTEFDITIEGVGTFTWGKTGSDGVIDTSHFFASTPSRIQEELSGPFEVTESMPNVISIIFTEV